MVEANCVLELDLHPASYLGSFLRMSLRTRLSFSPLLMKYGLLSASTHSLSLSHTQFGDLVEFLCRCSFLEIYNEQVYDLLDPASSGLHIQPHTTCTPYLASLHMHTLCGVVVEYMANE